MDEPVYTYYHPSVLQDHPDDTNSMILMQTALGVPLEDLVVRIPVRLKWYFAKVCAVWTSDTMGQHNKCCDNTNFFCIRDIYSKIKSKESLWDIFNDFGEDIHGAYDAILELNQPEIIENKLVFAPVDFEKHPEAFKQDGRGNFIYLL